MARRQADTRLAALAKRFADWRNKRVRGERIPESLWLAAARLTREIGLCRTAQALRLDYDKLKRRSEEAEALAPRFVELASASPDRECVVELEDPSGAKMRIHMKGQSLDLEALSSTFWGG